MTSGLNARSMRNSPFRESEWDRWLDHVLQDLENSTCSACEAASNQQQKTQCQFSVQAENKSASKVAAVRSVSTERGAAEQVSQQSGGYAQLTKSRSTSSLQGGERAIVADNMLKDLDQALKASTNYIESQSHRTVQLPNGTQEYHEYRSSSSTGTPRNAAGDFNLERQVSSMLPMEY